VADYMVKLYAMNFKKGTNIGRSTVEKDNNKTRPLINALPVNQVYDDSLIVEAI